MVTPKSPKSPSRNRRSIGSMFRIPSLHGRENQKAKGPMEELSASFSKSEHLGESVSDLSANRESDYESPVVKARKAPDADADDAETPRRRRRSVDDKERARSRRPDRPLDRKDRPDGGEPPRAVDLSPSKGVRKIRRKDNS